MSDTPPSNSSNGKRDKRPRLPGVSPIVPGRPGRPSFSLDALRERVEQQFNEETANRTDILLDLDSEAKRREVLEDVADYVLAVEAVTLTPADRKRLIDRAYVNLFSFGPLDALFHDDTVTEITINGPYSIHARRGLGPMTPVDTTFDDVYQLETILQRVIATAGITLSGPFHESGVVILGRPARLSVIGPPVRTDYSVGLRLHPQKPLTLDALHTHFGMLPPQAITLLRAILRGGHGLLIVGDVSLGKTTLASALLHALDHLTEGEWPIVTVERAAEMHLPAPVTRHTTDYRATADPGAGYIAAFTAALDEYPTWLFADEVRGDEAPALWDALTRPDPPRYVWIFRGSHHPERLKSAFEMVIRNHLPAVPQSEINRALADRLPFVVTLKRRGDTPLLDAVAEWILDEDAPSQIALQPLLQENNGTWTLTRTRASRPLDVPESFWNT